MNQKILVSESWVIQSFRIQSTLDLHAANKHLRSGYYVQGTMETIRHTLM